MSGFDVIVVGLGAMGSAALHQLAGRGLRVLGIEQFGIPHSHGSSGGDTRLIRKAYFEHPDYVPLLLRAYDLWSALEAEAGHRLLHRSGILYLGAADGEVIAGSELAAKRHGLALEAVDERTLSADYPQFRCPAGYVARFEPEAGFLLCEHAVRAHVEGAVARGASLLVGERVLSWSAGPAEVEVVTDTGRHRAASLVLTAGSWAARLLSDLGVDLQVTRQPQFWMLPPDRETFALGRLPCWAVQRHDRPGLFYGFPNLPAHLCAQLGAKLAYHDRGEPADPDQIRRPVTSAERNTLIDAVAPFIPGLRGSWTGSRVCLYTWSADGNFILDVHPEHRNVVFGCGFSGHGFKFAPVIGEALADLVTAGASSLPIEFLRLR